MYKIIFKNSTTNRLDLNISFTVTNVNYKNQEKTYETMLAMLREDQKIDTLREIVKLINHIHYMTTKVKVNTTQDKSIN